MGRISSSVGLISGLPIADTVDQLLSISGQPRDRLLERTSALQAEQVAITELTALVLGVQFSVKGLGKQAAFDKKSVSSSDESVLSASVTGTPAAGSFRFTPIRKAQSHQLVSGGLASSDSPLGEGEVTVRFGGHVDKPLALEHLNGGSGVARGQIRITDRSGDAAIVDLRFAQTVDDVLNAINTNLGIDVTASADGDRLRLTDNTGQSAANLRVQNVGVTTTATDLGLDAINVAASEATGNDVVHLSSSLALSQLNDGNGVALKRGVSDLTVSLADGTSLDVEFLAQTKGATQANATTTAVNGADAQVSFTSVGTGESFDGYQVRFVSDDNIAVGAETVDINTTNKTLTFSIDAGSTRAVHIVNALNNDETANQFFTAAVGASGDGTGFIDSDDRATTTGGAIAYADESTIGELVSTINSVDAAKLQARISAAGDAIELVDLTSGGNTFSVSSAVGGSVAEDLGLTTAASGGVITGERRIAGLKTVLLDSLAGGYGVGDLGVVSLTDRNGTATNVDLSNAATLEDVLATINSATTTAGVSVSAQINSQRNGIELVDTSNGTGNLVIANGDATNTADALRIATNATTSRVNSGSLDLQTFHEQIGLEDFNRGRGVDLGSFLITDSSGEIGAVNFATLGVKTLGDAIDAINALSIGVTARINDRGDGILVADTAGGSGDLTINDVGDGTAAADLGIAGTSTEVTINGTPTKVLDGSTTITVTLDSDDTLQDLVTKLNQETDDVAAAIFNGGAGANPFRLTVTSQISGSSGAVLVDASALGIDFQQTAAAQDALVVVGSLNTPTLGAVATSATNEFDELIDGLRIDIEAASTEEVTINVEQSEDAVVAQIELFVSQYNKLQDKLDEVTFFDGEQSTAGVLRGTTAALRIQFDLGNAITGRYFGVGSIQTLAELGINVDDQGQLRFSRAEFDSKYAQDPGAIERFFATADLGVADKLDAISEQLAGLEGSVLLNRAESLQRTIQLNDQRITEMNEALDRERISLLREFIRLESTLGQFQGTLNALSQIQPVAPLTLGGATSIGAT